MITYYSLATGRQVERHGPDPWLDASDGWARLYTAPVTPEPEGDSTPTESANQEETHDGGD